MSNSGRIRKENILKISFVRINGLITKFLTSNIYFIRNINGLFIMKLYFFIGSKLVCHMNLIIKVNHLCHILNTSPYVNPTLVWIVKDNLLHLSIFVHIHIYLFKFTINEHTIICCKNLINYRGRDRSRKINFYDLICFIDSHLLIFRYHFKIIQGPLHHILEKRYFYLLILQSPHYLAIMKN